MKDFKLNDLPKATIYRVPNEYFNQLPQVVMARVAEKESLATGTWWNPVWTGYRTALASIVLVLGFVTAFLLSQNFNTYHASPYAELAVINQQEALEYVSLLDEIESGDLVELNLTDNDVSAEFMPAAPVDLLETVDEQQLEEVYFN